MPQNLAHLIETERSYLFSEVDKFIGKYCGDFAPHLLDSDENDGQRLKDLMTEYDTKLIKAMQEVVNEGRKFENVDDYKKWEKDRLTEGYRKGMSEERQRIRQALQLALDNLENK